MKESHQKEFDPMMEVWKIMIEALRKQAFSVMLLLGAVLGLWQMMHLQKETFDIKISTLEAKVDTMAARYLHCEMSRARQAAKIEVMQADMDALKALRDKYGR